MKPFIFIPHLQVLENAKILMSPMPLSIIYFVSFLIEKEFFLFKIYLFFINRRGIFNPYAYFNPYPASPTSYVCIYQINIF